MAGRITDTVEDAKLVGATFRGAGVVFTLSLATLPLAVTLSFSVVYGVLGADGWTTVDQKEYAAETQQQQQQLRRDITDVAAANTETTKNLALIQQSLKNIEKTLSRLDNR